MSSRSHNLYASAAATSPAERVVTGDAALSLALQFQILKRVPRTGWLLRGVAPSEAENVAAHTGGMGLMALMLSELVTVTVDRGRLLAICLIHDLAEAVIGDLPGPATRFLPDGAKHKAERLALAELLDGIAFAGDWLGLWQEFTDASTTEGRLARDADHLDMIFQAYAYEQTGRIGLDEFWTGAMSASWYYAESKELARRLMLQRSSGPTGSQESLDD